MNPYRVVKVAAGWFAQVLQGARYETVAFCVSWEEAYDYLVAWKAINE